MERYLGYFRRLLEGMVADDAQVVDGLPLLPEEERRGCCMSGTTPRWSIRASSASMNCLKSR